MAERSKTKKEIVEMLLKKNLESNDEEELISEPQKQKENNSFSSVDLDSIAGESYNINK